MQTREEKRSYKKEIIRKLGQIGPICIFLGVIFLCQPFSLTMYTIGFPTVLAGVIITNIAAHL